MSHNNRGAFAHILQFSPIPIWPWNLKQQRVTRCGCHTTHTHTPGVPKPTTCVSTPYPCYCLHPSGLESKFEAYYKKLTPEAIQVRGLFKYDEMDSDSNSASDKKYRDMHDSRSVLVKIVYCMSMVMFYVNHEYRDFVETIPPA
jgi:hypothetical protein